MQKSAQNMNSNKRLTEAFTFSSLLAYITKGTSSKFSQRPVCTHAAVDPVPSLAVFRKQPGAEHVFGALFVFL
jgi:hypothetical protein